MKILSTEVSLFANISIEYLQNAITAPLIRPIIAQNFSFDNFLMACFVLLNHTIRYEEIVIFFSVYAEFASLFGGV